MKQFSQEKPDASSLTRWKQRIGEEGFQWLLAFTVELAIEKEVLKEKDLEEVIIDTTVMEKNITYPTDSKLLVKIIQLLNKEAAKIKLKLRQSFLRVSVHVARKVAQYAHAKQMKRMYRGVRKLKTITGRLVRDIQRKLECADQSTEMKRA